MRCVPARSQGQLDFLYLLLIVGHRSADNDRYYRQHQIVSSEHSNVQVQYKSSSRQCDWCPQLNSVSTVLFFCRCWLQRTESRSQRSHNETNHGRIGCVKSFRTVFALLHYPVNSRTCQFTKHRSTHRIQRHKSFVRYFSHV